MEKFAADGTDLGTFATGLGNPAGLYLDAVGNLLVCCPNQNQIRKFSPSGVDLGAFATTGNGTPVFIITTPVANPITSEPAGAALTAGANTTLSVIVNGTVLAYQWQKDGADLTDGGNIAGSTTANLQLSNVLGAAAGQYRVLVTTAAGTFSSTAASLTVKAAPNAGATYYVSYARTNQIEEFSKDGVDLGSFATGQSVPEGMIFDAQGNLYVAEYASRTIEKYSPTGQDLGVFANVGVNLVSMAMDIAGNVYVPDQSESVQRYSSSGAYLGAFASTVYTSIYGYIPFAATFDSGGNLVICNLNDNIQRYSPQGDNLGGFLTSNVSRPTALAFDPAGNLYVANQGSGNVEKYSANLTDLGVVATGLETLTEHNVTGLMVDGAGNLYICDPSQNEIRKISPTGADLGVFATTGIGGPVSMVEIPPPTPITCQPSAITLTGGANATFGVTVNSTVLSYQWQMDGVNLVDGGDIAGSNTSTLQVSGALGADAGSYRVMVTTAAGTFASAAAQLTVMAAPPTGSVFYISYPLEAKLEEFSADGVDLGTFINTRLGIPQGLTFATDGNLVVADAGGSVIEFSPVGIDVRNKYNDNFHGASAVIPDGAGGFYLSTSASSSDAPGSGITAGSIYDVNLSAGSATLLALAQRQPQGLALDAQGNLYIANTGGNTVSKFDVSGNSFFTGLSANISTPTGLALNWDGNLYVANQGTGIIERYSPNGVDLGAFATGLTDAGSLYFDAAGFLYVCCPSQNEIRKFSPTGEDLGVFATTGASLPAYVAETPVPSPITGQPVGGILHTGDTATLSVTVNGTGLGYQWQSDGGNLSDGEGISGTTSANLVMAGVTVAEAGHYRVLVTTVAGTVASAPAVLQVLAAPTSDNVFLVTDNNTNSVEMYTTDGTDLGPLAVTGMGDPRGMAVDGSDNLYVVNNQLNDVEKYSPTGEDLGTFITGLNDPVAILTDSAGNFYVANGGNSTVERFAPDGTDLGLFSYSESYDFGGPWGLGIALDTGGNLCVSNWYGGSVERYSPTGADLGAFVSSNITEPAGLAFDRAGNLYVASQRAGTVEKFAPDGTDLGVFATGLSSPTGLYFNRDGDLYVCNAGTGVVEMYAPDDTDLGAFSASPVGTPAYMIARPPPIQFQSEPTSLAFLTGETANFTVQVTGSNLAYQWLKDGQPLSNSGRISGAASPNLAITNVTGADAGEYDVAVSAGGSPLPSLVVPLVVVAAPTTSHVLLVSYGNTNTIEEFSEGVDLGIFPAKGLSSPAGLAVDGQGNVYVVNTTANTFDKFSATGELLFSTPTGAGPLGLAQDGAGNFYVAISGSNTIERYSPAGSDEGVFAQTQASPWGVAVNSLGEVYVSESAPSGGFGGGSVFTGGDGGGGVVVIDDTGTGTAGSVFSGGSSLTLGGGGGGASNGGMDAVELFSGNGKKLRTFTSGNLSQPAGLAVDAVGNVFVANQGSDSVEKFSPKGVDLGKAPLAGIGQPTGLLLVDDGDLFVAGSAANEIRQISQKTGEDSGPYVSTGMGLPVMMIGRAGVAKISRQPPVSLSMLGGKTTTLTATVTGTGLVYQWQKNGVNLTNGGRISGATTASLRIKGVTAADARQYQLVINSAGGPVATVMVTLTVQGIPVFVQQPTTTTVSAGGNFLLTTKATGMNPLAYQWYKNGAKLKNSGTHLLKVASAQLVVKKAVAGDAGTYTVTASNAAGLATSGAAMVTVNPAN